MTCKRVTIFEGPDGAGKSTIARDYAHLMCARYVHMGPFPGVPGPALARLYVEAMLPALLGYQDVVLDRCWLSEAPYGQAFRQGQVRLAPAHERMLARLAWRCGAVMVLCLPPRDTCHQNWAERRGTELLTDEAQLDAVYTTYEERLAADAFDLSVVVHDYTVDAGVPTWRGLVRLQKGTRPHTVEACSAGNRNAAVALVGEAFGEVKVHDPLYQWPFASFTDQGCSRWLTDQLAGAGIGEDQLFWVNADQLTEGTVDRLRAKQVVALGAVASRRLTETGVTHHLVDHPQHWRRFHADEPYPAPAIIRDLLANPKETTP